MCVLRIIFFVALHRSPKLNQRSAKNSAPRRRPTGLIVMMMPDGDQPRDCGPMLTITLLEAAASFACSRASVTLLLDHSLL